jgi:hypothetical protein
MSGDSTLPLARDGVGCRLRPGAVAIAIVGELLAVRASKQAWSLREK